jgi:hypothetical protein
LNILSSFLLPSIRYSSGASLWCLIHWKFLNGYVRVDAADRFQQDLSGEQAVVRSCMPEHVQNSLEYARSLSPGFACSDNRQERNSSRSSLLVPGEDSDS